MIPLFKNLGQEALTQLGQASTIEEFPDGELLLKQGDESVDVFILLRGTARVVADHDGTEEYYTTLSVGAVFGEMGVMRGQPRSASVRAGNSVRVLRIPGDAFRDLTERHEEISRLVLETMFGRFRADQARAKARASRRDTGGGKVVPFLSATGGAGTTLTLANVAAFLRDLTGDRVLAVDLDLMFGDLGPVFGIDEGPTISNLLMEPEITPEMVSDVTHEASEKVHVIPGPVMPEDAEFVEPGFLGRFLDVAVEAYDWVLVDTSGHVGDTTLELLDRASLAVYVATPDVTSVRNATRWFDLVDRVGIDVNRIRVLPNKVSGEDETAVGFLEKRFGHTMLPEVPLDVDAAKRSFNTGELVRDASPDLPLSQGLRRAAKELAGLDMSQPAAPEGPFWKRWL
jgi:pilus assembly protein CpaE